MNPPFLSHILFIDEAGFTWDGITNFYNTHVWADDNLQAILQSRYQHRFLFNILLQILWVTG
jgi:hypothetical protein